ncbi:MAG: SusE domain-containing protein [Marinilabiliales bacterium]|nr:SusE domain-containing protein [Marinilabiliales bacterium]
MNKKLSIYLAFIGLAGVLFSCSKDESKAILSDNPTAPSIVSVPDLTLKRANGLNTLEFVGTAVDPGFQASATYYLEACAKGTNFQDPLLILSDKQDLSMKITVADLDGILLKKFPADQVSSIDFQIRASLSVSSGTQSFTYTSAAKNANVTTYGPPTLAMTVAGKLQGIVSPGDNKVYSGWIYTDGTPFQLTNNDDGKKYGGTLAAGAVSCDLTENGPAIKLDAGGYNLTADINTGKMKLTLADVTIGIIGDAVGGWSDDTKMVYNFTDHTWNITKTVTAGGIKFRTHNSWAAVNVGYNPAGHSLNSLYQNDGKTDSQNIDDVAPGKYNIKLYLETTPIKAVFTPTN